MINKVESSGEKELWSRRYEQLRQRGSGNGDGLGDDSWGLSLLKRQGIAGWMQAWRDPVACAREIPPSNAAPRVDQIGSRRDEVALLLTNMALSHITQPLP